MFAKLQQRSSRLSSRRVVALLVIAVLVSTIICHNYWIEVRTLLPVPVAHFKPVQEVVSKPAETVSATETSGRSIKPLVYIFPQFHAIPENDKFWGVNFTEWTNVNKTSKNRIGQEILTPADSVGYYSLLDLSTRQRYTDLLRNMTAYGVVYHHYWFSGKPVMAKVLEAMIQDGQPDMPFMLSWANEPWTKRWDGRDGDDNLLMQDYGGVEDWRAHFDWLLTYFRHPNYIKVNGRLQFAVYAPWHIGYRGKRMYDAWRLWAVEAGFGGLDIIETQWHFHDPNRVGPADAIAEFQPHSGGLDPTGFVETPRGGRVFHRGLKVSFDNTPRHAANLSAGTIEPFAHPSLWKQTAIEVMQRMKLDPNPRGEENFLFVNALNEWGEGNALEPSKQWGDAYSVAFKEAKQIADAMPWREDVIERGLELTDEVKLTGGAVDVCVLIGVKDTVSPFESPWDLPQTLRSIQAQSNRQWQAIAYPIWSDTNQEMLDRHVMDTFDPRIQSSGIPKERLGNRTYGEIVAWFSTDWLIENLDWISKPCVSASSLLLVESGDTLDPSTFALASRSGSDGSDIIPLHFSNMDTVAVSRVEEAKQHCTRFRSDVAKICPLMTPHSTDADIGAMFINLAKWRSEKHKFSQYATYNKNSTAIFMQWLSSRAADPWTWASPQVEDESSSKQTCHVVHAATPLSCRRSGRIWLDVPGLQPAGPACYSPSDIVQTFGENTTTWDMQLWREDPFCLRLFRNETHTLV
ncbi:hypothetical protein ANO11243_010020 [Dothideomycetidae sp. 11243]|nr:hypothetical protein ANO11243_010020 [fungal sp. No.11243]